MFYIKNNKHISRNKITKEITPVKIMEYMAMKKPVLSNSLPAVVYELKKDSDVIFAKNLEDLIRKIGDLIPQKKELNEIGQRGYELVKEKYVWPKIIKNLKSIIIDLIRKKRLKKLSPDKSAPHP